MFIKPTVKGILSLSISNFLLNQAPAARGACGGCGGLDVVALVLAVAVLVALVVVADAEVHGDLLVVVLQAPLGVDLVLERPYGDALPVLYRDFESNKD